MLRHLHDEQCSSKSSGRWNCTEGCIASRVAVSRSHSQASEPAATTDAKTHKTHACPHWTVPMDVSRVAALLLQAPCRMCGELSTTECVDTIMEKNGAKIKDRVSGTFVPLEESHLSGVFHTQLPADTMAWEIPDGEFSNVAEIGAGAFGVVYSGLWRGTRVCLKQLHKHLNADEVAQAEFRLELKIMQQLHHPHIVQFLGTTVSDDGLTSIVSEYMSGGSLETLFRNDEIFPLKLSTKMALDCARGMAYLHGRSPLPVIHRDLKPGNLMLTANRTLKIGDFGLSKTLSVRNKLPQEMSQAFNMTGETGSYRYMAPEVFRHEFYGPAVDVYAASMIYYQLFSFQQPFAGRNPVDACRAASLENLRPPIREGYMPPELAALVARMWDPLVKKRPSFLEIIAELEPMVDKYANEPDAQPGCCVVS